MKLDPVGFAALAIALGWTMAYAGMKKHALEPKRRKRICPSCGRRITGRSCDGH